MASLLQLRAQLSSILLEISVIVIVTLLLATTIGISFFICYSLLVYGVF